MVRRKKLIQKYPRGGKPLVIFSHAHFAHEGAVYKHPSALSRRLFSWSRTGCRTGTIQTRSGAADFSRCGVIRLDNTKYCLRRLSCIDKKSAGAGLQSTSGREVFRWFCADGGQTILSIVKWRLCKSAEKKCSEACLYCSCSAYAPCDKKAPFLALGHFYAVRCVASKNKVFFIVHTHTVHLTGVWRANKIRREKLFSL